MLICFLCLKLSLRFPHTFFILILLQATQASCWLNFCQPVMHRLLSYGNENDNGYDKHLRSQTDLLCLNLDIIRIKLLILKNRLLLSSNYHPLLVLRLLSYLPFNTNPRKTLYQTFKMSLHKIVSQSLVSKPLVATSQCDQIAVLTFLWKTA